MNLMQKGAIQVKATIYHNPMCGTSRKTLEILRDSGFDVWVREYLKQPPTRDELVRLYDKAGISPREGLRSKEALAAELGLTRPDVSDDEILGMTRTAIEAAFVDEPTRQRLLSAL